jgi:hypothetical protein
MPVERRGQAIRVMVTLVNWQQEEPNDCGGGRQLSRDGTSRVTGDSHARFCERLGVKFPGPTRRRRVTGVPTATKRVKNEGRGLAPIEKNNSAYAHRTGPIEIDQVRLALNPFDGI